MPLDLRLTSEAAEQLRAAVEWWVANRAAAPTLLREQIERAFSVLVTQPRVGARVPDPDFLGVRRLHLSRVRYHVYYRVIDDAVVEILAVWHTSRRDGPPLSAPA